MPKWLKMGCGHLLALPLLLIGSITGLFFFLFLFEDNSSGVGELVFTGGVTAVTFGLAGALLFYLWTRVWPDSGDNMDPTSTSASVQSILEGLLPRNAAESLTKASTEARAPSSRDGGAPSPASSEATETDPPPEPSYLSPDQHPWTARDEWADPVIQTQKGTLEGGGTVWTLILGAIFFGTGGFILWTSFGGEFGALIFGLVFAVVGAGILALSLYRFLRRRRYGTTTFEMETFPGALGGILCGTLHTGVPLQESPPDGFRVKLSCYRRRITRDSDGDRTVSHDLLWRDEKKIKGRPASDGTALDVLLAFEVPSDQPASTAQKSSNRTMWVLEASADVSGIDYSAVLEIPVFPVEPDDSVIVGTYRKYEQEYGLDTPTSRGIKLRRPSRTHLEFDFGRARRPGVALLLTMLGLAITGGGGYLFIYGSLLGGGLLLLFGAIVDWGAYYYWTYHSRVVVRRDGITVQTGVLGSEQTTQFPCSALQEARLDIAGSNEYVLHLSYADAGEGASSPRSSGEVVAARMLTDHQEAEWIASQIEQAAAERARYE